MGSRNRQLQHEQGHRTRSPCRLYFCGVAGKGTKTFVNTKCFQLITCNGVCSIDPPGIVEGTAEWEEHPTGKCDETRGCKCWTPTADGGSCVKDEPTDTRPCILGSAGGPPSISNLYQCYDTVCTD